MTQSGIDVRLTIGNTAQGAAALHEGAADLAFIEGMIEDPMLTKEQVARDQSVIVVGTEHAWSATDPLEPDRLVEAEWVLREPRSGTRSTFEAALQGFGVSPSALRLALELPILTCTVVPPLFEGHDRGPVRRIWRYGLLPSVAEKVRPSTSVSCTYLAPAIVPEAGTGSVTVAAAPILARIPKGPGSNLL